MSGELEMWEYDSAREGRDDGNWKGGHLVQILHID